MDDEDIGVFICLAFLFTLFSCIIYTVSFGPYALVAALNYSGMFKIWSVGFISTLAVITIGTHAFSRGNIKDLIDEVPEEQLNGMHPYISMVLAIFILFTVPGVFLQKLITTAILIEILEFMYSRYKDDIFPQKNNEDSD